jgi:hypothetical protein
MDHKDQWTQFCDILNIYKNKGRKLFGSIGRIVWLTL